jgi:hypothetical protein
MKIMKRMKYMMEKKLTVEKKKRAIMIWEVMKEWKLGGLRS